MAKNVSAKKSLRQSHRKEAFNTRSTEAFKEVKKDIRKLLEVGKAKEAKVELNKLYSKVDAAVKKQVIHKNTGSRLKSRTAALIKKADK